jgi:multiple sugar transport system ATP-binding protein
MNMVDVLRTGEALTAHGVELAITDAQRAAVQAHTSAELVYGLRPESISFAATGLPGTLSMIEPTGPETYATVDTPAGKLTARVPGVLQAAVGDAVHVQWSADQSHLFDRASGSRVG